MRARETFAYTVPALALAAIGIPLYIFVPKFYSDVVGLPVAFIGQMLLLVRLFDAISDPTIGWLSDRTRSRMGRRRPWILLGSIPLALSFAALLSPPAAASVGQLQLWFGVGLFTTFLFWTVVAIPYEALGAELLFDYDARTRLLGLREAFVIGGTVLAAALPVFLQVEDPRTQWRLMAAIYVVLIIGLNTWCALGVRERIRPERFLDGRGSSPLRQRSFMILLFAFTITSLGSNLPPAIFLFYVEYVLESAHGEVYLLAYLALNVIFLPVWIRLARIKGKRAAWAGSLIMMILAFGWAFGLGAGDEVAFRWMVLFTGMAGGGVLALPHAMQADVIDEDELASGERREGQFIGLWNIARKLSAALSVGLGLWWLGQLGYEAGATQSDSVILALRWLYVGIPCLCFAVGLLVLRAYPLDRARHAEIRAAITASGGASAGLD